MKDKELKVYYNNINGYQSKRDSLLKIIEAENPDLITLCETKREDTGKTKADEIPGYDIIERNVKRGKEGLLFAIRKGSYKSMNEITQCELKSILSIRIEFQQCTLRIILGHAPQESATLEERETFFSELTQQVERCITTGEKMILVGDLNARIMNNDGIQAVSSNGKMLKEIMDEYDLGAANFHKNTSGKWTRIQVMKNGCVKKSVLDYILMEKDLLEKIQSMVIDEDKFFCPYRQQKVKGGKINITHSDHFAFILTAQINIGQPKLDKKKQDKRWNFSEEGYNVYKEESQKEMKVKGNVDPTKAYNSWSKEFEHLLHRCFSKKTVKDKINVCPPSKKSKNIRAILSEMSKSGKIQRKVAKRYMKTVLVIESKLAAEARAKRLTKTMENLTENEKFSPSGFWKMKKAADKKFVHKEASTCIQKENGVKVEGEAAVVEAYAEEFQHRLRNREPAKEWEEYVAETNNMIRSWIKKDCRSSPAFTMKELRAIIKRLKKGKSPGCDTYPAELFIYAGDGMLESLLEMFNWIKESGETPEQWDVLKIATIYKQKGSKMMLKFYRGIFLALVVSKIFEGLIKERINKDLTNINILQAGSAQNRSAADNVFLLRASFDHHKHTKKPLFVTAYDYEQAFDSLWVEDCIVSLAKLNVSKEMLKLIYNLNKRALVSVNTPFGPTRQFETDPIVKQGTVLGSVLCSSSTGEYCDENTGIKLGEAEISSLLYVDDIIDLSQTLNDCIKAHKNALLFSLRKKLSLSGTKCFNMVLNQDNNNKPPILTIDEKKKVVNTEEIVYLGDVFDSKGTNDGLIKDRIKRATKAMICISSLATETDLGIHHVNVCLLLYQSLFLSTMLFNSQTWSNLRKKDVEDLRRVQSKFLKKILRLPDSTCNALTFLEFGVLPIEQEIHKRQLMYLHRVLNLDSDDPVKKVFEFQQTQAENDGEKNWWSGVKELLKIYCVGSLSEIQALSKDAFKKLVNSKVKEVSFNNLKDQCRRKKKTSDLEHKEFGLQNYMKELFPEQARTVFKSRSQTLDLKTHLTYKYDNNDIKCRVCGKAEETLEHVVNCGEDEELFLDVDQNNHKMNTLRCLKRIDNFVQKVSSQQQNKTDQ